MATTSITIRVFQLEKSADLEAQQRVSHVC
jgi:hypothetical protein